MGSLIIIFTKALSHILNFFYTYNTHRKIGWLKGQLYSHWISSEFKVFGKYSTINRPIDLKGGKYISIGSNSGIGSNSILTAWDRYETDTFTPEILIGDNVWIGENSHITAINKICIGNHVLTGKKITISDNSHGKFESDLLILPPSKRPLYSKGPVIIEDGVWIGDKVTILAGVTIGRNAVIGANSLVNKDIPANSLVGGIPAKVLKQF